MNGTINKIPKYTVSHPAKVRLDDAVLCLNCDCVYNWKEVKGCPNCTSENYVFLIKWLGTNSCIDFLNKDDRQN